MIVTSLALSLPSRPWSFRFLFLCQLVPCNVTAECERHRMRGRKKMLHQISIFAVFLYIPCERWNSYYWNKKNQCLPSREAVRRKKPFYITSNHMTVSIFYCIQKKGEEKKRIEIQTTHTHTHIRTPFITNRIFNLTGACDTLIEGKKHVTNENILHDEKVT